MLQTYEAVLQPNWGLEFSGPTPPHFDRAQKVLVTVLQDDVEDAGSAPLQADWAQVTGLLKDSTLFGADPLAAQQGMRKEWR